MKEVVEQAVEEVLNESVEQQAEEPTNPADGDQQVMEQAVEQVLPKTGEQQAEVQTNPTAADDDDLVITKEVTKPQPNPADVITFDSDGEDDRRRESDNDDMEPGEDKKLTTDEKTGLKVKVDKDWFTIHQEMLARREARAKEKEDRARELKEAREATAAANANAAAAAAANERAAAIQAQSTEQMSVLQSQLQFLAAKINVPLDSIPVIAASPCIATPQPPLPSTTAPVSPVVEHQSEDTPDRRLDDNVDAIPSDAVPPPPLPAASAPVAPVVEHEPVETPDRRLDDTDVSVSLAHQDRVPSTPASQIAKIPSPEGSAFEVRVPQSTEEGSPQVHDRRVDDNAMEVAEPLTFTGAPEALVCTTSREDPSELQFPPPMEEERVDYEMAEEDLLEFNDADLPPAPEVPPQDSAEPDQVQPSDPYDFD
jgi:hypothetical protein